MLIHVDEDRHVVVPPRAGGLVQPHRLDVRQVELRNCLVDIVLHDTPQPLVGDLDDAVVLEEIQVPPGFLLEVMGGAGLVAHRAGIFGAALGFHFQGIPLKTSRIPFPTLHRLHARDS